MTHTHAPDKYKYIPYNDFLRHSRLNSHFYNVLIFKTLKNII